MMIGVWCLVRAAPHLPERCCCYFGVRAICSPVDRMQVLHLCCITFTLGEDGGVTSVCAAFKVKSGLDAWS